MSTTSMESSLYYNGWLMEPPAFTNAVYDRMVYLRRRNEAKYLGQGNHRMTPWGREQKK